jgi:hypothetical protein
MRRSIRAGSRDSVALQFARESAGRAGDLFIRVGVCAETVVKNQKRFGKAGEIQEEIDQRFARHLVGRTAYLKRTFNGPSEVW